MPKQMPKQMTKQMTKQVTNQMTKQVIEQPVKRTRNPQLEMLKKYPMSYGGELLKTRKGRAHGRPLDTKHTMHLVLRSTKAKGKWSFLVPTNKESIRKILKKFSAKYGVKILSLGNAGNHLHIHLKLGNRHTYKPFIRAITASIAMAVTQMNRWTKIRIKFWDHRPFTTIAKSYKQYLNLKDYIRINQYEGLGYSRKTARYFISKGVRLNARHFISKGVRPNSLLY